MRRLVLFLTLTSFLCAQEVEDGAVDDVPPTAEAEAMPPPSPPKNSTDRRNWIFAAGSIVAATLAIVVVSLNPGASPPSKKTQ